MALIPQGTFRTLVRSPFIIASAVFVSRVAGLFVEWLWRPWALRLEGPYGWEVGRVAQSIASGKGFANTLALFDSGPTAWLCPGYPYLVAAIFKVLGIYSVPSHVVLLVVNCLFVALTVFPIYAIARRTFGRQVAVWSSWTWLALPSAWILPKFVWDSSVDALCLASIVWATFAVRGRRGAAAWAAYGLLWAAVTLINASNLSLLPLLLIWLIWVLHKQHRPAARMIGVMLVTLALGIAPWTLRNYIVFHKLVPIRSNMGLMLWFGSHPGAQGIDTTLSPFANPVQAELYKQMGEIPYMTAKKHEAVAYIKSHPGKTVDLALHGMWTYWFEVSDRHNIAWYESSSRFVKAYFTLNICVVSGIVFGLVLALRKRVRGAVIYLAVVAAFPLVYYITRPAFRFRFTIEPVAIILVAYSLSWVWAHFPSHATKKALARSVPEPATETASA